MTFVTLAHGVLDLQRVYGMFVPPTPLRWSRGPFVNGNNLAGYVNLALFAGAGLWLSPERKLPAWPFLLGIPILAAQVLLSESRGGILCLVLGTLWLGYRTLRHRRIVSGRLLASVAAAVMLSLVVALAVGGARLPATLSDLDMQAKVSVWRWSLDMIRDFPVFGVGRGAFETAFEPYRRLLGHEVTMVFPYAENFLLQWVADWGVAVAVVAFAAAVALVWRPLAGAVHEPLASALATGLGAILLQNLVDLGLEIFRSVCACVGRVRRRRRTVRVRATRPGPRRADRDPSCFGYGGNRRRSRRHSGSYRKAAGFQGLLGLGSERGARSGGLSPNPQDPDAPAPGRSVLPARRLRCRRQGGR